MRSSGGRRAIDGAPALAVFVQAARAFTPSARKATAEPLTRETIAAALEENDQNLAAAARALNVHRTQLYRRMAELDMPTPGGRKNV